MSGADDRPSRRGRKLKDDERQLWRTVARSVKPLRLRPAEDDIEEPSAKANVAPPSPAATRAAKAIPVSRPAKQAVPAPPALESIGRRDKARIARGRAAIDGRIDLHGRTQAEAYDALMHFIRRSQSQGARTVLVITGKGRSDSDGGRGVLKRQVPMWLAMPELRPLVIGYDAASAGHGGEGALYVRLRRDRALTP